MSPGAGQAMVALSTGHILLSLLAVCPNKTQQWVLNLAVPHIKEEKGGHISNPTPQTVHPGDSQVGGGETNGRDSSPSFPVPADPGKAQKLCLRGGRGDSATAGRAARRGEGASGSAGSASHSRRKGRGGGGPRAVSQTRRRARRGRSARDRVAPSGSERARRQRGHVRGPSSCACLPRAPRSPFINSPPAPRPPGTGARRERRAAARPPAPHGPRAPALR